MTEVAWHYMLAEALYRGFLLRVNSTASPRRFHWYVTDEDRVKKGPPDSRQQKSDANGFSSTFEKAQKDAKDMADAIIKQQETSQISS